MGVFLGEVFGYFGSEGLLREGIWNFFWKIYKKNFLQKNCPTTPSLKLVRKVQGCLYVL